MALQQSNCPGCNGVIEFDSSAIQVACPQCNMQFGGPGASQVLPIAPQPTPQVPQNAVQTQPQWETPRWEQPVHPTSLQGGPQTTPTMNRPTGAAPSPFQTPAAPSAPMPQANVPLPGISPNTMPMPGMSLPHNQPANRNGMMFAMVASALALGFVGLVIGSVSLYFLTSSSVEPVAAAPNEVNDPQPSGPPTFESPAPVSPPSVTPPSIVPRPNVAAAPTTPTQNDVPPTEPATPTVSIPSVPVVENGSDSKEPEPTPSVVVQPPANGSRLGLGYKWKTGDEHTYKITIKTEQGGKEKTINAQCSYKVGDTAIQGFEMEDATGTAFVVSADGYLVTCAHVIEDASDVEVTISGKAYKATIVDANYVQDLALLKVNATELKALPLVDSNSVQQGQEIRAVGYPLANVLGSNVKVTKGTVSGFVQEEHGKRFQVDASINPGNSGGPILDEKGNVIGIASSKLLGIEVTSVGFAVPSNQANELLKKNSIKSLPKASVGSALSGPHLVTAVKPAVAFVKSSFGGVERKRYRITYTGVFTQYVPYAQSRMGGRFGFGGPRFGGLGPAMPDVPETQSANGSLSATKYGEVTGFTGDTQFPYVLGQVGMLCLEDLHHHHNGQWGSESQTVLHIVEPAKGHGFPFTPSFGLGGRFGRSQPKDKVKESYPAIERTRYTLVSQDKNQFVLKKTYEFRTLEDEKNPYMLVKGGGTVVFDRVVGMPKSLKCKATLVRNVDNATVRMPLNVAYELHDPVEVAKERAEAKVRLAKAMEEREAKKKADAEAAKAAATVPNPERINELLKAISAKSIDEFMQHQDLEKLSKLAIVEERRSEAVKLATERMGSSNNDVVRTAMVLLVSWGTKDDIVRVLVPYLGKIENKVDFRSQATVFTKLSEHDDPSIIKALVIRLIVREDVKHATKALVAIGPKCEDLLLVAYQKEERVRVPSIDVFKQIGTEKCISVLERAELDTDNGTTQRRLREARKAIKARVSGA